VLFVYTFFYIVTTLFISTRTMATLVENAIGVLIAIIVVGLVAIPIVQDALVTETETVENESFTSSGTLPESFTVSNVGTGVVEDSETITFKNTTGDGSTVELAESDYTFDYETGEFTVESVTGATPEDGDEYLVDYTYKPTGYIESAVSRTVVNHITTILAVALLITGFSVVMRGG